MFDRDIQFWKVFFFWECYIWTYFVVINIQFIFEVLYFRIKHLTKQCFLIILSEPPLPPLPKTRSRPAPLTPPSNVSSPPRRAYLNLHLHFGLFREHLHPPPTVVPPSFCLQLRLHLQFDFYSFISKSTFTFTSLPSAHHLHLHIWINFHLPFLVHLPRYLHLNFHYHLNHLHVCLSLDINSIYYPRSTTSPAQLFIIIISFHKHFQLFLHRNHHLNLQLSPLDLHRQECSSLLITLSQAGLVKPPLSCFRWWRGVVTPILWVWVNAVCGAVCAFVMMGYVCSVWWAV